MSKRTKTTGRKDFIGAALHAEQDEADDERYYGLYEARVTDNRDPENQGRLKAQVFFFEEDEEPFESGWITRKTIFRGPTRLSRGRKFGDDWPLPEVGGVIYVQAVAGNKHNLVWDGMPGYQEGQYGAPDLDKDKHRDWALRLALQNGWECGVDTEGSMYVVVPGNLRIKVQGSIFVSSRGIITIIGSKLRNLALTVLRLCGVTIDKSNYVRPDEAAEVREMMRDAMSGPPGRPDPGIQKVEDLE